MVRMKSYKRIALIGLDGSGKSANINAMKQDEDYDGYRFSWVRWEPKLLGPAYWLLNRSVKKRKEVVANGAIYKYQQKTSEEQKKMSNEYNAKVGMKETIFKNSVIRTAWMLLALIDYLIQFYIKTFRLIIGRESIIFDRFYLDLFVDQGINFGYDPEKINDEIQKYQKLFPQIDCFIYIRVSPETCYKRKDDIPNLEYLLRRYEIYEKLSQNKRWFIVDGELPFQEVYASIKKINLEHF